MKTKVYFIPGTQCDERLWQFLWPEMSDEYQLIHLEIPNENSVENLVSELAKRLPNEKINLLGFSLGGYLASTFALLYPERINSLVILANTPNILPAEEIASREKIVKWIGKHGYKGMTVARANSFLHTRHHNNQAILSLIQGMDLSLGQETLLQQLAASTQRKNLLPAFERLQKPILFCFGEQDHLVTKSSFEVLAKNNAQVKYHEIINAGHMLPLEQPLLLAQKLKHFYSGITELQ